MGACAVPHRSRASGLGSPSRRGVLKEVKRPVLSCGSATPRSSTGVASSRGGGRHQAGRRSARRWASLLAPPPVVLGHAEKGFARIGAERQADGVETPPRGGLERGLERAGKLAPHG